MTLIRSSDQVTTLIREMQTDWPPDDPDLQRIADALPVRCLELALVKKADDPQAAPIHVGQCAETASQKLAILRVIYAAWLRAPGVELGVLISEACIAQEPRDLGRSIVEEVLVFIGDAGLASAIEKRYPPRQ